MAKYISLFLILELLNEEFPWDSNLLQMENPKEGPAPWLEKDAIYTALNKMKDGKAAGVLGIVAEMLKASREAGLELFIELFNNIVKEQKVPSDWETSVIIIACFVHMKCPKSLACTSRLIFLHRFETQVAKRTLCDEVKELEGVFTNHSHCAALPSPVLFRQSGGPHHHQSVSQKCLLSEVVDSEVL